MSLISNHPVKGFKCPVCNSELIYASYRDSEFKHFPNTIRYSCLFTFCDEDGEDDVCSYHFFIKPGRLAIWNAKRHE